MVELNPPKKFVPKLTLTLPNFAPVISVPLKLKSKSALIVGKEKLLPKIETLGKDETISNLRLLAAAMAKVLLLPFGSMVKFAVTALSLA